MLRNCKRLLSLLLVLTLVLGVLPGSVWAVGSGVTDPIQGGNRPVYYTYTPDGDGGTWSPADMTSEDTVPAVSNGAGNNVPGVEVRKTIRPADAENEFDITLQVETTQKIQVTESGADTAVVLLLDATQSMGSDTSTTSDFGRAKAAANAFLDNYAATAGGKRYVSVIRYGEKAQMVQGWTEVSNVYSPDALAPLQQKITKLKTISGTNTDAGLLAVEQQLALVGQGNVPAITNKFVVLLTDGEPNDNTGANLSKDANYPLPDGYNFKPDRRGGWNSDYANPARRAMKIRNVDQAALYSIYIDDDNDESKLGYRWLRCFSDAAYVGSAQELNGIFTTVIERIRLAVDAWKVTDPMGQLIQFVGVQNPNQHAPGAFDALPDGSGALVWNLRRDLGGSATVITKEGGGRLDAADYETYDGPCTVSYRLTYRVRLDTADRLFDETVYHRTNGPTSLSYYLTDGRGNLIDNTGAVIPTTQNALQTLYFKVPAVAGAVPVEDYAIAYYKWDRQAGRFPTEPTATSDHRAKLWSHVSIGALDEDYVNRYSTESGGYYRLEGDETHQNLPAFQLVPGGQRVLRAYYRPTPVDVTVEHIVTTIRETDDGPVATVAEPVTETVADLCKGDLYAPQPWEDLKLDPDQASDLTERTLLSGTNVFRIYYVQTEEARTPVPYTIDYRYREGSWQIDAATGLLTHRYPDYPASGLTVTPTGRHGAVVQAPLTGKETVNGTFSLDQEATAATSMRLDRSGNNTLTIYLQKPGVQPVSDATLEVEHIYLRTVAGGATVEDGREQIQAQPVYAGETRTVTATPVYGEHSYSQWRYSTGQTDQADVACAMVPGANKLTITYLRDARVPTDVAVLHEFYEKRWEIDETGAAVLVIPAAPTDTQTGQITGCFVGEAATATLWDLSGQYAGYAHDGGSLTLEPLAAGGNVMTVRYYKEPVDDLGSGDVTVTHTYRTYESYVDDQGVPVVDALTEVDGPSEFWSGMVGQWRDFDAVLTYPEGGADYALTSPAAAPARVTLAAPGGQMAFTYERHVSTLEETAYTVQPVCVTYERTIGADGQQAVLEVSREAGTLWSSAEQADLTVYNGQVLRIDPGLYAPEGFTFDAADRETTAGYDSFRLQADGNAVVLVYARTVDNFTAATVKVRNHYTFTITEYIGGERTETPVTEMVPGATDYPILVNQFFTTTGLGTGRPGYALTEAPADTVQVTADTLENGVFYLDFYYEGALDRTPEQQATVQVIHTYTTIDDSGDNAPVVEVFGDRPEDIITGYFATETYVAALAPQGGFTAEHVRGVSPQGAADPETGLVLSSGANTITIDYERHYNSRVSTAVRVQHNYFARDTFTVDLGLSDADFLATATAETQVVEVLSGRENGIWVGNAFTAAQQPVYQWQDDGGVAHSTTYALADAMPAGGVIASLAEDGNEVTLNYIRYYSTRPETVSIGIVHQYHTDGILDTTAAETRTVAFESAVTAADYAVPNGYTLDTAHAATQNLAKAMGGETITLRYYRTTGGGGGGNSGPDVPVRHTVTVSYVDETGASLRPAYVAQLTEGAAYDVSQQTATEIEGYTIASVTGDAVRGTMDADKAIVVTYTPAAQITEPEVPLAQPDVPPGPDATAEQAASDGVIIVDPEVPLGDLPLTGRQAQPVNYLLTGGALAVLLSLVSAGLLRRRRDDNE